MEVKFRIDVEEKSSEVQACRLYAKRKKSSFSFNKLLRNIKMCGLPLLRHRMFLYEIPPYIFNFNFNPKRNSIFFNPHLLFILNLLHCLQCIGSGRDSGIPPSPPNTGLTWHEPKQAEPGVFTAQHWVKVVRCGPFLCSAPQRANIWWRSTLKHVFFGPTTSRQRETRR